MHVVIHFLNNCLLSRPRHASLRTWMRISLRPWDDRPSVMAINWLLECRMMGAKSCLLLLSRYDPFDPSCGPSHNHGPVGSALEWKRATMDINNNESGVREVSLTSSQELVLHLCSERPATVIIWDSAFLSLGLTNGHSNWKIYSWEKIDLPNCVTTSIIRQEVEKVTLIECQFHFKMRCLR